MLDKILPGELGAQCTRSPANLRHKAGAQRGLSAVARGIGKAWIDVQAAVEEIINMGSIETLSFLIVIGHHDDLRIASAIRVGVFATFRHPVPEALHDFLRPFVAVVAQVRIHVVVGETKIPRLDAPPTGNPDGRVRLLQWPGPDVDVPELRILPVKTKGLGARPGLDDEAVGFVVLVPQRGRWLHRSRNWCPSTCPLGSPPPGAHHS